MGGVTSYATTIIAHPNPSNSATGGFATLGTVLGFVIGKKAFYKQQKIDISEDYVVKRAIGLAFFCLFLHGSTRHGSGKIKKWVKC